MQMSYRRRHYIIHGLISSLGNFTSPDDLNLVLVKNHQIEILVVTPDGLRPIKNLVINGKVDVMKFYRPPGELKDRLFLVTARHDAMILETIGSGHDLHIVTISHGSVSDRFGKKVETGTLAVIDPEARMIGLCMYEGRFMIIRLESDQPKLQAYNIGMEEYGVLDIKFLHGCAQPTIVLLHQAGQGRHIKTHEISIKDKKFVRVPWKQDNVDMITSKANMLIPVPQPIGGCIIVGLESIVYHDGLYYLATEPATMQWSTIVCYCQIDADGMRYLLGDKEGHLYMLLLIRNERSAGPLVKDLVLEVLGETTIPACMTYLDNSYVYLGSRLGDSQLVRLNVQPDENKSDVTIVESYTNLGPIMDMVVVDLESKGQSQVVTCSGIGKEGSLRIIRNDIVIHELASIDLSGIKGMWPLRCGTSKVFDNVLILSFVEQTTVLKLNGEEVEEIEILGFFPDQQTFHAGNTVHSQIIQITPNSVRLVGMESLQLVDEWKPPNGRDISVASCNNSQVVCATGPIIFYLDVAESKLVQTADTTLQYEIACIDVTPLNDEDEKATLCCVGLWTEISVRLLELPSLQEIAKEPLGGEVIPRSILMAQFESTKYLLCGLGDGSLIYFVMTTRGLAEKKMVTLGTQPTSLRRLKTQSTMNVFAFSDRQPSVIYSSREKLVVNEINFGQVNHMCPLNAEAYKDSLALVNDSTITIGSTDAMKKLYVRTVALAESPLRIAYQEETKTFGVITMRHEVKGGMTPARASVSTLAVSKSFSSSSEATPAVNKGQEQKVCSLLIIDENTFEVLHAHQFMQHEYALSLISSKLGEDSTPYFIVGTGLVNSGEAEPIAGRLLLFQWEDGKFDTLAEEDIRGGCYSLCKFKNELLAVVNDSLQRFEWTFEKYLRQTWYLGTENNCFIVGDLAQKDAKSLVKCKKIERMFGEISLDPAPEPLSMTVLDFFDNDTLIGVPNGGNLLVWQMHSAASTDEIFLHGKKVGQIHVGDAINVIRRGSLALRNLGEDEEDQRSVLVGTVHGALGMVKPLPQEFFELLTEIQRRLARVIKPVGKIEHEAWRSIDNELKTEPMEGFVDGDLVEAFLDLDDQQMTEVYQGLQINHGSGMKQDAKVEDIIKIIKDLTQMH